VLEQSGEPIDSLPALSRLEVHTAETALSQILDTLDREHFDYVGLLASDVRDRLFLARHIRKHCPSTRLFAFGADTLYLNPGENPYLTGMLVVTPYPLFAANQTWTFPFAGSRQRWHAPSSPAQGIYNALLLHLQRVDDLLEYGQPFGRPKVDEQRYPTLWLSVVGRSTLWPLATFDVAEAENEMEYLAKACTDEAREPSNALAGLEATPRHSPPTVAVFVLALTAVLAALLGIATLLLAAGAWRGWAGFKGRLEQFAAILADPIGAGERFDHRAHLLVALTSLAVPGILFAAAVLSLDRWSPWVGPIPWPLWSVVLGAATILAATAVAALRATAALRPWWRTQPGGWLRWGQGAGVILTLGGSAGALVLSLWAAASWWGGAPPGDTAALFRALRAFGLLSGVNPLVPLTLVGLVGFAWGLSMLARVRLMESLHGPRQFLDLGGRSFRGVAAHEQRMQDALVFGFHALPPWPALIIVAAAIDCAAWWWLAPSLEGRAFDALFRAVFLAMSFAIVVIFLRSLWLWQELRQLLGRLACHPMVEAYQRLPPGLPWSPVLGWTGRHRALSGLGYAVERLGLATVALKGEKGTSPSDLAKLEKLSRRATAAFHGAEARQSAGRRDKAQACQCVLQAHLTAAGRALVPLLEERWPGIAREKKLEDRGDFVARAEEFVASRVAVFVQVGMTHARNLTGFVVAALVLMLVAAISYPLQPRKLFLGYHWVAILTVVIAAVTTLAEMNRDRVLSYLAHTPPGSVRWNREWVFRLVTYGLIPLLTLLAAQFPEVGAGFLSALRAAIGALGPASGLGPSQ
jgi:hypothetical protein